MKDLVIAWLIANFNETRIQEMIDEEIPNWVDQDWEDDGDYNSEEEWYEDHNNREAQDEVRMTIEAQTYLHFNVTKEQYLEETKEELYQTILNHSNDIGAAL